MLQPLAAAHNVAEALTLRIMLPNCGVFLIVARVRS